MKKLLSALVILLITASSKGQRSIESLFNKYSGNEGFITLTINGNLFKLFRCLDEDDDWDSGPAEITEIRILVQEDERLKTENFYDVVMRGIDRNRYEEFMSVNESHQDMIMLVRSEGKVLKEFLVIGGGDDNLLIQVKGNMTRAEARKLSDDLRENKGERIVESVQ
jgi:hypothetical protein